MKLRSQIFTILFIELFFLAGCRKDKSLPEKPPPSPPDVQAQFIYGGWETSGAIMCSMLRMYFFTDGTWRDSTCWCLGWDVSNANPYGSGTFYIQNDSLIKFIINFQLDTILRNSWKITYLNENQLILNRSDCGWSGFRKIN